MWVIFVLSAAVFGLIALILLFIGPHETSTTSTAYLQQEVLSMAKKKKEIKCTAEYTEGCAQRLTDALVDIYYQRKAQGRLGEIEKCKEDKTA